MLTTHERKLRPRLRRRGEKPTSSAADHEGRRAAAAHFPQDRCASLIDTQQTADPPVIRGLLKKWDLPTTTASMRHTKGTAADQAAMAAGMTNAEMKSLKLLRKGTAFDKRFLSQMIIHHGGAVKLANIELADGESSAAKAFARKVASSQSKQIVVMKHLLATL